MKIKGTNDLLKRLKKGASIKDIKEVVKVNTLELQQAQQKDAPVDTGFLRRSITSEFEDGGLTGKTGATAEYAPYLIYGTRYMYAQDFFRPNFHVQEKKFQNDLKKLTR